MDINKLYDIAENENIEVVNFSLPTTVSMAHMTDNKDCYVAMDYKQIESASEERTRLAHEIGHCVKGAFYNRYSKFDLMCRHEYRANKWAIETLMPFDEVIEALKSGYEQVWELAEYFEVTEDLVRKAFWIYFDKIV